MDQKTDDEIEKMFGDITVRELKIENTDLKSKTEKI